MKQTLKKSVSILLSLIMVFSLFTIVPITAQATETPTVLNGLTVGPSETITITTDTVINGDVIVEGNLVISGNTHVTVNGTVYLNNNGFIGD